MTPVVVDLDASVGPLPGERRLDQADWQEALRFGCRRAVLARWWRQTQAALPRTPRLAFLGSGDFHHLSLPLVGAVASRQPFDVVVFDNHPDNMRYAFGVHCGSWVRHVAALPQVAHVQVVGIHSADIAVGHAWENHWRPLLGGRLSYRGLRVDTRWARRVGLGAAIRSFDTAAELLQSLRDDRARSRRPVYVSIDKDVLAPEVARTNWDQGVMDEATLGLALAELRHGLVGADITGEVSVWRYRSRLKRLLSAVDAQPTVDAAQLAAWQAGQHALNLRLLPRLLALA